MKFRRDLLIPVLLANVVVWSVVFAEDRAGLLTVAFLDIGQGDSIFIEAPNGNQVLIDGGIGRQVLRQLGQFMSAYDRSLDLVVATHPDADHIGGLIDVLERFQVAGFMDPGRSSDTLTYARLEELVVAEGAERLLARRGLRLWLDEQIFIDVLFPDREMPGNDTNSSSIVLKLRDGENTFLLTGDAPQAIENYLVNLDGDALQSDVLKAGHHGSKTSSGRAFVATIKPNHAVISAGAGNRYGHPHEEALLILKEFAGQIWRTDEQGAVVFKSDGTSLAITTER
mgnify:CR=1 FL=1